jgi:hypothetical protein
MTPNGPVPFSSAEEAEWDAREAIEEQRFARRALEEYKTRRELEYPDFRDYLDAVVKGSDAQLSEYVRKCEAVKIKYPKPSAE